MSRILYKVVKDTAYEHYFELNARIGDVLELKNEKISSEGVKKFLAKSRANVDDWICCCDKDDLFGYVRLSNLEIVTDASYARELMLYLFYKAIQAGRKESITIRQLQVDIEMLFFESTEMCSLFVECVTAVLNLEGTRYSSKWYALVLFEIFATNFTSLWEFAENNIAYFSIFLNTIVGDQLCPASTRKKIVNVLERWCCGIFFCNVENDSKLEMLCSISQYESGLDSNGIEVVKNDDMDVHQNRVDSSNSEMEVSDTSSSACGTSTDQTGSSGDGLTDESNANSSSSSSDQKVHICKPYVNPSENSIVHDLQLGYRFSYNAAQLFNHIKQYTKFYRTHEVQEIPDQTLGQGASGTAVLVQVYDNITLMVMKKFDQQQQRYVEYILKEFIKLIQSWNHPNIVSLYGIVVTNDEVAKPVGLLIEYMDRKSLHDTIHNDPDYHYGEKEVLEWCLQAASAIKHLHDKDLIHRDIKPGNFLMKSTSQENTRILKLADFGMVKRHEPTMPPNAPKSHFGTPHYRAPEGNPKIKDSYTAAVDIYSFGITIWEMAERKLPDANFVPVLTKKGRVSRPSLANPKYSWLPGLVQRMWAEDPKERPLIGEVYMHLLTAYNELCRIEVTKAQIQH